jgi:hypothetical protein
LVPDHPRRATPFCDDDIDAEVLPKLTAEDLALGVTSAAPAETARCYRRLERQARSEAKCRLDSVSRIPWEHLPRYSVVVGRVRRTLALLIRSPAWQSLPVAGLPPADFAGAALSSAPAFLLG